MGEIGHGHDGIAHLDVDRRRLVMRPLQEPIQQPDFVQNLESRGMDGVTTEVAEKVRVLLQDGDFDPGAGKEKPQHQPGGAAADDTASNLNGLGDGVCPPAEPPAPSG